MPDALFKSKDVKIETLGNYLKKVREKLNMDIKTVSLLTQIKPVYLENLEAGTFEKLPADVYIRGFLKNLSQLYHLEEQSLIEQFEKEHGFSSATKRRESQNRPRIFFTPKTVILVASIAVFLGAAVYVVSEIQSVLAPPKLAISEPSEDISVTGNSIVVSGIAEVGADVSINDQAVLVDQNGQFNENVILGPGLNLIEIKAKNKFNKISTVLRRINAQIEQQEVATTTLPINISIEIGPNPAWVSIEADGVIVTRGTMLAGASKSISAKQDILLTSANAGSTKIIYNGKDLGILGREGEVIRNVEFSSTQTK